MEVIFGYQMGLNLGLLGVVSWVSGVGTMIYDVFSNPAPTFASTSRERLSDCADRGESDIDCACKIDMES